MIALESESISLDAPNGSEAVRRNSSLLYWMVLGAATTASTLGYDVGIMAAAIQPIEQDFSLTGVQKEIAMGSLNFVRMSLLRTTTSQKN